MDNHSNHLITDATRDRATVLAQLKAFHQCLCPICDEDNNPYKCCACQNEVVSHDYSIIDNKGYSNGMLCLLCYSALAALPLPNWLKVNPLVECLHFNQSPGWRGQGYCRDCRRRGPFRHASHSSQAEPDVTSGDPISAQTGAQRADFTPVLCPQCGVDINRSGLLAHYVVKKCNGHFGHQLAVAGG